MDRGTGFILLGLSATLIGLSGRLPLGSFHRPGPGLYPFVLACALAFLAILLLVSSWRPRREDAPAAEGADLKKVLYILGILVVYACAFRSVGFLLSTFLFLLLLKPILQKGWAFVLIGAVLVSAASFFIFDYLLQAQLPRGFLGI